MKEHANDTGVHFADLGVQYSSARNLPELTGAGSEPHFGVLMLDGFYHLETHMGQLECVSTYL